MDNSSNIFIVVKDISLQDQCLRDYLELESCLSSGNWKAAIVLSGSLIEAVLLDALSYSSVANQRLGDVQKRDDATLFNLLRWAQDCDLIDSGIFGLADKIRDYRNLIHPKVYLRRMITVSSNVAQISYNVLLEVVRQLTASSDDDLDATIADIVKHATGGDATPADLRVYTPIVRKYGKVRGTEIIRRSLTFSSGK